MRGYQGEDTELHREIHQLQANHAVGPTKNLAAGVAQCFPSSTVNIPSAAETRTAALRMKVTVAV